jgi:predicted regulator of Ras-like GTPase activity (Roadblock/LC7/MglB family)
MHLERRGHRSDIRPEAMGLALAAAAARHGADAALLASEDGLLVAGSGAGLDLDVLAAFAPFAGSVDARLRAETRGRPLHVAPIRVGERRLLLASVGEPLGDVARVEAAARRILAA